MPTRLGMPANGGMPFASCEQPRKVPPASPVAPARAYLWAFPLAMIERVPPADGGFSTAVASIVRVLPA